MSIPGSLQSFLPALLMALSVTVGVFSILRLVIRTRPKESEDWRDPPPLIYKLFKPIVRLFAADAKNVMSDKIYAKTQGRLSAGGMNYAIMPEEFQTLKVICLLFGGLLSFLLLKYMEYFEAEIMSFLSMLPIDFEVQIFLILLPPLGFFYPDIWLRDKIIGRRNRVSKEFPFLLDLLVLSMRAGLNYSTSLGQAISSLPNGPVKEEFGKLLREIRAGKVRRDALLDLAARMDINSVRNFVSAINQAEETGGEIVEVLTVQAEQRRAERFNDAEAAANKAPVKMLIPMMLFLFPIVFMLVGFIMVVKLAESNLLPDVLLRLLLS